MDDWLEIGRIVAPQGLSGEVRVYPNSDFPERFLQPGERWLLRPDATEPESIQLLAGRFLQGKGLYVVQLEGIRHRDQSERLRGCTLWVPASDRPALDEDEYHVVDLLGVAVFDHNTDELIGRVKDVIPAGNDLLEVELVQPTSNTAQESPPPPSSSPPPHPSSPPTPDRFLRKKARRARAKKKKPTQSPTVLIPFVPEIVPVVDLEAGRITISPPPGLLDERAQEEA